MKDFLKDYGIIIFAALALIQPWLIILWKRYYKKSKLEIYKTGQLEVGYSSYGVTLGVVGTLRAFNTDVFIENISIEVIKQKNSSRSEYEWGIFRDQKFSTSGGEQATLELPSAFMTSKSLPKRFNIQFHNKVVQSEIIKILTELQNKWFDELEAKKLNYANKEDPMIKKEIYELYITFKENPIHIVSYTKLDRLCDWEAGEYSLTIRVKTSEPNNEFMKSFKFELTDDDFKKLRLNTIFMLQATCEQPTFGDYHFVNAKYQEI